MVRQSEDRDIQRLLAEERPSRSRIGAAEQRTNSSGQTAAKQWRPLAREWLTAPKWWPRQFAEKWPNSGDWPDSQWLTTAEWRRLAEQQLNGGGDWPDNDLMVAE